MYIHTYVCIHITISVTIYVTLSHLKSKQLYHVPLTRCVTNFQSVAQLTIGMQITIPTTSHWNADTQCIVSIVTMALKMLHSIRIYITCAVMTS